HQREMGLLEQLVVKNCVDMVQATPGRMQMFTMSSSGRSCLGNLKELMVGGEALPDKLLADLTQSTQAKIYNMYGPTETTIWSTVKDLTGAEEINIGTPIQNTVIYIYDKHYHLQPVGVPGELCIGGDGLARGYINRPQLTADRFHRSYKSYMSPIYRTGDLARWLPDGNIEFLGRMDHQVKVRGFRIELGEIENQLLTHGKIKEAIVIARDNNNDKYLCAYMVAKPGETNPIDLSGLREYLSNRLPDYMVPAYFVQLDNIPLTPNGKIDRKALPDQVFAAGQDYTAPRSRIEKELVDIWAEVLGRDQLHVTQLRQSIGIDNNFFQLGGHSLKATILIARIHKKYDVQIPLVEFFKNPTIKKLAGYMHCTGRDKFVSIEPVEKKEYYALSSAQKRLYILYRFEKDSKAYNMPLILTLEGNITPGTMEETFKKLISRHESLRTWFGKINEEPVQGIQGDVEFEIEYLNISQDEPDFNVKEESSLEIGNSQLEAIIIDLFVRPFDLAKAPLIRVGLRKIEKYKHILMIDIHHIITDGVSYNILLRDFTSLYAGQKLPPLMLQYKEYSEWQQSREVQNTIKDQEEYWLKEFEENIPVLNLPADYSRPPVKSFEGDNIGFSLSVEEIRRLNEIAHIERTTLFMVILAAYNILLAKLSSQEDIVVGIPIAGRRHTDLETIVGVFINTLALRNYPSGEKTCKRFLKEIKEKTIKSFENQDYQLEDLVEKAAVKRDRSRNPLFDVSFSH
ncbi:condensation domain-containing protein, partial [Acidobacteriota bacterium]